jgi:hypothetical protein
VVGRAPRLSRVQPSLHLTTDGLQDLHKKNKGLIDDAQNTFKEEVSFGLQEVARRLRCW